MVGRSLWRDRRLVANCSECLEKAGHQPSSNSVLWQLRAKLPAVPDGVAKPT